MNRHTSGQQQGSVHGRVPPMEAAVPESLQLYNQLIDQVSDGILITDSNQLIVYINPSGCEMFGYTRDELIGIPFARLIGRENSLTLSDLLPETGSTAALELRCRRKNGSALLAEIHLKLLSPGQLQVILHDITKRRQAEAKLRESEARYRAIVEDQEELIRRFRPDLTLTFVNRAFCRYFGKTKSELLGHSFLTLLPPEDHATVRKEFATLSPDHPVMVSERRFVRLDGEVRWQQWVNRGIFDQDGTLSAIQSVGRDITAQRLMEQQLRQSEARYRAVVEDQTDAIRRFQPDGTLTFVNNAFCRYYGKTREELLGQNFLIFVHPDDREAVAKVIAVLGPDHPVDITEPRIIRPNGEIIWIQYVNRVILDADGKIVEYQSVGRDMTAQKEAEFQIAEARQATARAARVATLAIIGGGIAHEINQPLNAIKILAETVLYLFEAKGNPPADEVVKSVSNISRQVDRIDSIVNHLRSFLRTSQNFAQRPCDLNDVVGKALPLVNNQLVSRQIRVSQELSPDLPPVCGDFVGFEEIVLNLLMNAIQALDGTDVKGKTIMVRTWADVRVHIEVSDNGPGIDRAIRDKVLEPFFTTKKSGDSMGLGLSIVQSIATASNGQVSIENSPMGGARVEVSFPISER